MMRASTATSTTTTAPTPPDIPHEQLHRAAWMAGVMGSINVLSQVLAARLILLVAVAGATFLTWLALQTPDPYRLAVLGVYAAVVVVPLVWLAARR
jgi:hypothetical protein